MKKKWEVEEPTYIVSCLKTFKKSSYVVHGEKPKIIV
jgi:hypothetical protein